MQSVEIIDERYETEFIYFPENHCFDFSFLYRV